MLGAPFYIVNLSPLKFSLGVSLLVHGVVISGAVWLGHFWESPVSITVTAPTTLELIAAPVSSPVQSVVKPIAPAPMPSQPQQEVIPETPLELPKIEDAIVPLPVQPVDESKLIAQTVIPVLETVFTPVPTTVHGDNSLPTSGKDFTTAVGSPMAKAKPDYLKNPEPEYPLAARRRGQEGSVVLSVTVSGAGRAVEILIKQSSGHELLDQAAVKAVRAWEFEPARIGAVGVESKIEVPVRFKLNRQ